MERIIIKTCDTCKCPTMTTINSTVCAGYRSGDEVIYQIEKCSTWKPAPINWTVAEAIAYTKHVGIPMSRPTIIRLCQEHKAGRQLGSKKGGRWIIKAEKFKAVVNGENACQ
jgi:hypothetical protein